jgi:very-short-patch-repair endonuclease
MIDRNVYDFLSSLEKKVYDWLTKNNIPFGTQEPMFGVAGELGSAIVDFVIPDRILVLRVMGAYYHSTLESKARDEFGKEQLINRGYLVVDLLERNLTDDKIENTMKLALQGQEVL